MVYHLRNAWYRMLYEVYANRISGTPRRNASNNGSFHDGQTSNHVSWPIPTCQ